MSKRLSVKIAGILILVMVVIMVVFSIYFVKSRTALMAEDLLTTGKIATLTEAKAMEHVLTQALQSGKLTESDIFDQNYVPIPNTDPQKYRTRYDAYLDAHIQDLEDEYLKDDQVAYALLVDQNGYLPTHHRKNSQPLTGDKQKDLVGNRTKRLFNKERELIAARSQEPFLKQVVHRDTGETIWHLSAPVNVNGKHWGAVTVGLSMDKMHKKIAHLRIQVIGAMVIMLLIASLTIYLVVSHFMRPLLKLTEAARRIADGNLDEEVRVESEDEIGRLSQALNTMTTVIVRNLKGEVEKTTRLIESIKEAIRQLSTSATEMMAISAEQSAGSVQQAGAVQEVTTTSER